MLQLHHMLYRTCNLQKSDILTIILVASNLGMMAMYPVVAEQADSYNELMKKFPKQMLEGLGMSSLNFNRILDYFAYAFCFILFYSMYCL